MEYGINKVMEGGGFMSEKKNVNVSYLIVIY